MMKKAELVFLPAPGVGHLVSAVEVAKLLVDLNANLSISVLTIKQPLNYKATAYIDYLKATTTTTTRIKVIDLPQSDAAMDRLKFVGSLVQTHGPLVKEAVAKIVENSNSVTGSPRLAGFVFDMFCTSFRDLANDFGAPSYLFCTSGAGFLGFLFFAQALHDEQNFEFVELTDSDTEFTIPSYVNPVSTKFFPTVTFKPEGFGFLVNIAKGVREMKGIMVNTVSELESHAVDSLSNGKLPPVYPVGPILFVKALVGSIRTMTQSCNGSTDNLGHLWCFSALGAWEVLVRIR
ncbi:hypothetical protein J1N35_000698 [Gossypium stocksii]|uniref:Uncharacterized protein n=1 Tax=Gossypium stocksii TaxID=47602 RepID=A0A9D3WI48_9ROSI|nr:hypothetical protein J1N35_000698 [Gossypium stocksii]